MPGTQIASQEAPTTLLATETVFRGNAAPEWMATRPVKWAALGALGLAGGVRDGLLFMDRNCS